MRAAGPSRLDQAGGIVAALILALGAQAVVLAVVPSAIFDLDRFTVPKELALLAAAALAGVIGLLRTDRIEFGIAEILLAGFTIFSAASAAAATNRWISLRSFGLTIGGVAVFFVARSIAIRVGRGAVLVPLLLAVVAAGTTGLLQAYGWSSDLLAASRLASFAAASIASAPIPSSSRSNVGSMPSGQSPSFTHHNISAASSITLKSTAPAESSFERIWATAAFVSRQ